MSKILSFFVILLCVIVLSACAVSQTAASVALDRTSHSSAPSVHGFDMLSSDKEINGRASSPTQFEISDINSDGMITNLDILAVFKYIYNSELYPLGSIGGFTHGDANMDGGVSNSDILILFRYIYSWGELYAN